MLGFTVDRFRKHQAKIHEKSNSHTNQSKNTFQRKKVFNPIDAFIEERYQPFLN